MKKICLLVITVLFCLSLSSCKGPQWLAWLPWVEADDETNEEKPSTTQTSGIEDSDNSSISYDSVEITISKYGDINSLQDIDKNKIVGPTTDKEFDLASLTQGKMVLVRVKFCVSNKGETDYVFKPHFTISKSKGYQLSNYSEESAIIKPENEGTADEKIVVRGLSKTIRSGNKGQVVPYVFVYECTKTPNVSMVYQDWEFFDDTKSLTQLIHSVSVSLKFPKNYEKIKEPEYKYNDNSIDIFSTDSNVKYVNYYFGGHLDELNKNGGKYTLQINKSGKYTLKLRSNVLDIMDYSKDFDVVVLADVSNLIISNDKKVSFNKNNLANKYEIVIKDSSGNTKYSSIVTNTIIDISDAISSYSSGEYTVYVYANSSENLVFRSINGTKTKITKLNEPVISVKGLKISWEEVKEATKYLVYKNNELVKETRELSYRDASALPTDNFYVIAASDSPYYFNSNKSNVVSINAM